MYSLTEILTRLRGKGRANTLDVSVLRDGFSSVKNPHCSISVSSPTSTVVTNSNTWYKAAGTTILNNTPYLMSMPENNRITYTGNKERHFHCVGSLSMTFDSGNNQTMSVAFAVNGTIADETILERFVTANDVGSTAIHGDFHLNNGDYIELWVRNNGATSNITVSHLYMFTMGMWT